MKKSILIVLILFFLAPSAFVWADWASRFVVYAGDMYEVTDETVSPDDIENEIGKVTRYSDKEGTYAGNFSNTFPKGTAYYSIINLDVQEAIAILTSDGTYIKAVNKGHYNNDFVEIRSWLILILAGGFVIFVISLAAMKKRITVTTIIVLVLALMLVAVLVGIKNLNFGQIDLLNKLQTSIFKRVDVDKLYEETPFIFEAGKELKMHHPLPSADDETNIDELYASTPFIEQAREGDGGIIKNRNAAVFPYSFQINLYSQQYSSDLQIMAKDRIRVAALGENESALDKTESFFDITLLVDDVSYGTYRYKTGSWGFSDWASIPAGKLKLVLTHPNTVKNSEIVGFGAIMVD